MNEMYFLVIQSGESFFFFAIFISRFSCLIDLCVCVWFRFLSFGSFDDDLQRYAKQSNGYSVCTVLFRTFFRTKQKQKIPFSGPKIEMK